MRKRLILDHEKAMSFEMSSSENDRLSCEVEKQRERDVERREFSFEPVFERGDEQVEDVE